jgi:hypothetical protein
MDVQGAAERWLARHGLSVATVGMLTRAVQDELVRIVDEVQ